MSATLEVRRPLILSTTDLLNNGDHLDQSTFHHLYEQTPEGFHAELIQGVDFVACAVSNPHGDFHAEVVTWLGVYKAHTPGTEVVDNGIVILDETNEPQPDALLRIAESAGGNSRISDEKYIVGPPELHVEIAHTSAAIDLYDKKDAYAEAGVLEYLVVLLREQELRCFRLIEGEYRETFAGSSGVWKSEVFPGLWLDCGALLQRDSLKLLECLQQGIETPERQAFRRKLTPAP